jgi:hypothetical protein
MALHTKAQEYWQSLLEGRRLPSLKDMTNEQLGDFRTKSFLLNFPDIFSDPVIKFVGDDVTVFYEEPDGLAGSNLGSLPETSILGSLTSSLSRVIEELECVEVSASYVDLLGEAEIRPCALLPFSDDGEVVQFILGVFGDQVAGEEAAATTMDSGGLFQLVEESREIAQSILRVDNRSRNTLYKVLELAYGLFGETQKDRPSYEVLLAGAGIREQVRAPFTPIVKLIFGKDYDKTRLTEYAAALSYAERQDIPKDKVHDFLDDHPGGIKGCVKEERKARRKAKGDVVDRLDQALDILRKAPVLARVKAPEITCGEDEVIMILARKGKGRSKDSLELLQKVDGPPSVIEGLIKKAALPKK